MYSDYHVHSHFSFDSEESPQNIVRQAIRLQMPQICFTDHQDFNWPVEGETPLIPLEQYFSELSYLKEVYQGQIDILTGIELGLMQGNETLCHDLLQHHSFDFVIGSCHVVNGMDPYYPVFWEQRTDRDAFEQYFHTLLGALKNFYHTAPSATSKIHTLGHLDYIVRYSPNRDANYTVADYHDVIDEILQFLIAKDICLEINTANLANGFDFPNPHAEIIKRYRELGGIYVTVGSDAHKASDIGYGFDVAADIVKRYQLKIYQKE